MNMSEPCPCNSSLEYEKCCLPFLEGIQKAPTAEALMRSRYTAYAKGNIDYIRDTYDPKRQSDFDEESTKNWALKSQWLGLEILKTELGSAQDTRGVVEFVANFEVSGENHQHHEIAEFRKNSEGRWYFVDGKTPKIEPLRRDTEKVGRNDLCPCGSGKKYKRCHG